MLHGYEDIYGPTHTGVNTIMGNRLHSCGFLNKYILFHRPGR